MRQFETPMMKQYMDIKKKYSDCLLFFRLGDFYELFMEDAHIGAQVLGITLTSRPKGKDGRVPMAGVPFHAVDSYLSKLVKAGYKVAICEQITEPNKKGIVERDVVRVVTPGTLLDERALERKEHNYICAINLNNFKWVLVYCDITTGDFWAQENDIEDFSQVISDELARIKPAECLLPSKLYENVELMETLRKEKNMSIFPVLQWKDYAKNAEETLKKQFQVSTLASFNISNKQLVIETASLLLNYLRDTQKNDLAHIRKISFREADTFVHLDRATIINLELFSTIKDRETNGSLLSTMDKTETPMGGRLLRSWILQPLTDKTAIELRLESVSELINEEKILRKTQKALRDMNDLERILSRITIGIGNARDLTALSTNVRLVFETKHALINTKSQMLQKMQKNISTRLWELVTLVESSIVSDPPIHIKEGGMIKDGVNKRLDELRTIVSSGHTWISNLEATERKRTGIGSLKLRFNKVFGFYIEVSKSNLALVPKDYIRKQTLVNGERYITPELKEKEELILRSDEEMKLLEYTIYKEILAKALTYTPLIQKAAHAVASVDCILSNAVLAKAGRYVRPTIVYSQELRVKEGRHPVINEIVGRNNFVPNSINFGPTHGTLFLITGPNMAGKSVYLRQTAILVLMALMGSFVPAKAAQIPIVDAIFVRSGAADVITSGLSTFMVEMVETAYILNHATSKSLIIMDEIGRGTSTYDGVSIAWATVEYLVTHFKQTPKTLFATHYFELTDLAEAFPGKVKNMHMAVIEENGVPTFLHSIKNGSASKSFGVAVASLAGMPKEVVNKAYALLGELEQTTPPNSGSHAKVEVQNNQLKELQAIDINKITPIEALNILSKLKQIKENDINS